MIRAAWSRPIWATLTAVASGAIGAVLALATVTDADSIAARTAHLEEQGWGLVTVSSTAGAGLEAQACSVAASVPNVRAAGLVEASIDANAVGLDAGLTITAVGPEIPSMVWPDASLPAPSHAIVTPGLNALTGLDDGVVYLLQGGTPVPVNVSSIEGPSRYAALDGGLLEVRSDATTAQYCRARYLLNRSKPLHRTSVWQHHRSMHLPYPLYPRPTRHRLPRCSFRATAIGISR